MNIVKNQIDELNLQLTVTVAHDDYAEIEKKELQKCKRTAEFKGFRKGMVPMSLIQSLRRACTWRVCEPRAFRGYQQFHQREQYQDGRRGSS